MARWLAIAVFCTACAPDVGAKKAEPTTGPTATHTTTAPTGSGWTTTDPATLDCAFEPAEPVVITEYPIGTEEDFAFDGAGRMVYQSGGALVSSGPAGNILPIGPGPADPSGLAMLSPTELVVAAPDSGSLSLVDLETGSSVVLAGGLDQPNGLETDWDGRVYVTERVAGRVIWLDPESGEAGIMAEGLNRPNGLALNAEEDRLFIATEDGVYGIERLNDDWTGTLPKRLFEFEERVFVGTVEVDRCGFLYTIDYATGEVLRIDPDTGDSLLLVDLSAGASFGFGTLKFGNGGGWSRSELFTSNRRVVTGIDVGIPGVLSPAAR